MHGFPFITSDGKYVGFVMDKVITYRVNYEDDYLKIKNLFEKSVDNNLVSYDHEYAKTTEDSDELIFLDLGVCGIFDTSEEALRELVDSDILTLASTKLYEYFKDKMQRENEMRGEISRGGKRNKKTKRKHNKIRRKTKAKTSKKIKRRNKRKHT